MNKWSGALAMACAAALGNWAMGAPFSPTASTDLGRPGSDPVAAGSWVYDSEEDMHVVQGGGSDWWDGGEYAHFAYAPVSGDFWLEADVGWVNRTGNWADMNDWVKAGVAVRNNVNTGAGNEKAVNYISAFLRPNRREAAFQGRNVATQNMFNVQTGGLPVSDVGRVALNRWTDPNDGLTLVQGFVDKGSGWEVIGSSWALNIANDAYAGLFVTAHENDGRLEKAEFRNAQILDAVAPSGALPRKPGAFLSTPETVQGVVGGWGVLEVINNGNVGSVGEAITKLQSGGTRHQYNLMGGLNIRDHEGNGKNFGGDRGYGVVYAGLATAGAVDDISLLARGKILIPEDGQYTFYINGDDGKELSIDYDPFKTIVANETWDASLFMTVHLTKGVHDIQVIHREDGGGADIEVAAAKGATTNLNQFALIGAGTPERQAYTIHVPGIVGTVTTKATPHKESGGPGNFEQAKAAIDAAIGDGSILTGTADRVQHHDPNNSGTWFGTGAIAFPNNDGGRDDNNFAFNASGQIEIVEGGTYYIGFDSDDGAALQIVGQTWKQILWSDQGAGRIEGDWMINDVWTGHSNTVGEIDLAPGVYDFNFYSYEGGGGAHAAVFGSDDINNVNQIIFGSARNVEVPYRAASLQLVPEPGTFGLLALGALGLISRRRRA